MEKVNTFINSFRKFWTNSFNECFAIFLYNFIFIEFKNTLYYIRKTSVPVIKNNKSHVDDNMTFV